MKHSNHVIKEFIMYKLLFAPVLCVLSVRRAAVSGLEYITCTCNTLAALTVQSNVHPASVRPTLGHVLSSRFLGDRSSLGAVIVPQATEHLASDHLAHVHADQSHDEHAVAA